MPLLITLLILAIGLFWILGPTVFFKSVLHLKNAIRSAVANAIGHEDVIPDVRSSVPNTPEEQAVAQWLAKGWPKTNMNSPCACMGKNHPDDPACSCKMRYHERIDGQWYRINEKPDKSGYVASKVLS